MQAMRNPACVRPALLPIIVALLLVCLPCAPLFSTAAALAAPPQERLNVLMIVVDDMNVSLGCYGHPVVKSPHIDRLAREGVRFDRAYCNHPVCNASRTSFLSGRRELVTAKTEGKTLWLPELFSKQGYYTAAVGKVTHSYGITTEVIPWDLMDLETETFQGKPRDADEEQVDGRTAARIVQLLEQRKDEPFFIAAGFWKPHSPLQSPRQYHGLYDPEKMTLPGEPAKHLAGIPPIALQNLGPYPSKQADEEKRLSIARYFSCISYIDAQVGKILAAVDRLGLKERTAILFFSDHGMHFYEHGGLRGKRTLFEESVRAPFILSVPGKQPGGVCSRLVEYVDIYPTLADLCVLPAPKGLDGASIVPLLNNPQAPGKEAIFVTTAREQGPAGRLVRTERHAYMQWGTAETAELYDMQNDPRQYENLAHDPQHAETVKRLRQLLESQAGRASGKP